MRILITGNMGYVGPAVVDRLRQSRRSAELVGFDMGYFAHCLTGADFLPETRLDLQVYGDVRTLRQEQLAGVDAVVHLAAISNDPMGKAYEQITDDVNHQASVRVARLAREIGARAFVFASSCSVYGYAEGAARDERSSLNPLTAYARSKIDTEKDVAGLADENFVVTCLRFPTACGMSPRLRLDLVLNDFMASAIAAGRIDILSDGTPWRPLIDTRDMALAIDWALDRRPERGSPFLAVNVGRNQWNYQVRDLAEAVKQCLPDVEISVNPDAPPDRRSYQVDFSLYRELAGDEWLPQHDLADSIEALRGGLTTMAFREAEFRDSNFMRLRALGCLRESGYLDDALSWRVGGDASQ
jgi:nucleoside-diphosphate-sugar epimerase